MQTYLGQKIQNQITINKEKKSSVALTQLSLTLHYSRRVFYY